MEWETAIGKPLLKKGGLELKSKNYRQVSNLCFLSKLVKRCMLCQHLTHCNENLQPDFQSAYHQNYSTKTCLMKLCTDILWATEKQNIWATMGIILDLSSAFDIVDQGVLLERMKHFRLTDNVLKWLDKYRRPRCCKLCIGNSYSTPKELNFSVPQGSCSGANITCYNVLIEKAIPLHITINEFANDHSIRKTYKGSDR